MVDSRLSECIRERKAEVEPTNKRLNNLANDRWTAGGADGQPGLTVFEDYRGTHARQGPFSWCDGVGFGAEEAECVGRPWCDGKIIHLIVEHNSSAWNDHLGA